MGILQDIKSAAAHSGANKAKIIYFREGTKVRIRFLSDMDDGMKVSFHDSFEHGINSPCQEVFGRECPYCEDESLRTRDQYIWSVFDYDSSEVKLLMSPVNNCSPIPAIVGMYEAYGTLTDRDYVITKTGKAQNTQYSVVPMDKKTFRNNKVKPFSESAVLKILDKAFPFDDATDDEEEEENKTKAKKNNKKSAAKSKTKKEYDYDNEENDNEEPWAEEEEESNDIDVDYEELSPKELYKLCEERGIIAPKKKPAQYYIKLLEEWDESEDDWGDSDDDDED